MDNAYAQRLKKIQNTDRKPQDGKTVAGFSVLGVPSTPHIRSVTRENTASCVVLPTPEGNHTTTNTSGHDLAQQSFSGPDPTRISDPMTQPDIDMLPPDPVLHPVSTGPQTISIQNEMQNGLMSDPDNSTAADADASAPDMSAHPSDTASSFGDWMVSENMITPKGLREARSFQNNFGGSVAQAVLKLGLAREQDVLAAWSAYIGIPLLQEMVSVQPQKTEIEAAAKALGLSVQWLVEREASVWFRPVREPDQIVDNSTASDRSVLGRDDLMLMVMAREPLLSGLQEELSRRWSGHIQYVLAANRLIDSLLSGVHDDQLDTGDDGIKSLAQLRELAEEAPVIDFVNGLFSDAFELDASDVHIEPQQHTFQTRFRVDGVLGHARSNPAAIFDSVATRIKILSGMDIAERRLPQDGRQGIRVAGEDVDLRVSTLPGTHGESLVLRILRKKSELPDIEGLGLRGAHLDEFESLIGLPNGVILVTGPTGSGKSTTLYRALESLNDGASKIITIEDPVEYEIEGINQVQARSEIGLTFAQGLRATLRQDPDIIMVGEIRDQETAMIAIQAALTGHLVFSTLHTNSAIGAVERLIDLGADPFLISASLRGAIGQRLLRRLCNTCKTPCSDRETRQNAVIAHMRRDCPALIEKLGTDYHRAVGCDACSGSGYRGRVGVFEMVNFHAMETAGDTAEITERATLPYLRNKGFSTMLEDGLVKASRGETSMEEIERVFGHWQE